MQSEQPQTCGQGLALNADLPRKLSELEAALATVLELHIKALDASDPGSRPERDAYRELTTAHREIASKLEATATRMAGYRDLPMARHDMAVLADAEHSRAFRKYIEIEQELRALLDEHLARDRKTLEMF